MKKFLFWVVVFLLPLTTALNCQELNKDYQELCFKIKSLNLSQEYETSLILDMINNWRLKPNHEFVNNWNSGLKLNNSPYNRGVGAEYIQDAWFNILTISPSVKEDNILYVPNKAKIFSAYNYQISHPTKLYPGDCKTKYKLVENTSTLEIYANNELIGNDKITSFEIIDELDNITFVGILSIRVRYQVIRYRLANGVCTFYRDTDYTGESTVRNDVLIVRLYNNNLNFDLNLTPQYNQTIQGELISNNYTAINLFFGDSYYQKTKYQYYYEFGPGNILSIKAKKDEKINYSEIIVNSFLNKIFFKVSQPSECEIRIYDHFNSNFKHCELNFLEEEINIIIDNKTHFKENETIKIEIIPRNVYVNVTYGNKRFIVKDKIYLNAIPGQNEIIIEFDNKTIRKIITVFDSSKLKTIRNIFLILGLTFVIYIILKKFYISLNSNERM
jgi:hypothetical protein